MKRASVVHNPFPGPQPYRAADRDRFYGRDAIVKKLTNQLLARSSTTLYGPSGAGKSSLMQAGVIPRLQESHDFLVVRVDGWPPGEAPLHWLVRALYSDLELGAPPSEAAGLEALDEAMALAERRSDQPILIYLDQLEQLLFPGRSEAEAEALIAAIDRLARAPIQGLQIVLALREDYLGRFRDRTRDRKELLAHSFRLGPLTVGEMVKSVCRAASLGAPPQRWDEGQIRGLMCDVRTPGQSASDEAEVQAAYAQIVCRALFQTRSETALDDEEDPASSVRTSLLPRERTGRIYINTIEPSGESEAEFILRHYLDATLDELGEIGPDARRLLEDHLVTADGSRTLRTENELLRILPPERLQPILRTLERAAILHAEAHQGSRYFEIGHDWLARKVHEQRQSREQQEEQRRRDEEQEEELRRQRAEADARFARSRAQRRFLALVALVSIALAAGAGVLGLWAFSQQKTAEDAGRAMRVALEQAQAAEKDANEKAIEASDARVLAGFRELKSRGQIAWGTKLLADVQRPAVARGFIALASDALESSALAATLSGHERALSAAAFSPDGEKIITGSEDGTARIFAASGEGNSIVLKGHRGPVTAAAFRPDGQRALTASEDGTARIWSADGSGVPATIEVPGGAVFSAAWSPDGARVVTASADNIARVWRADGGGMVELKGHTGRLTTATFLSKDRVLTTSEDATARVFRADGGGEPVVFKEHKSAIHFAAVSPDGARVLSVSADKTARVWGASGKTIDKSIVLNGHTDDVLYGAWSPDGRRVATASADRTARVWSSDGKGNPIVFSGHSLAVTFVGFRPDGRYLSTASLDRTARLWPSEGGEPLELRGHEAPVISAAFSPDGARVVTAAGAEAGSRSSDFAAKIWRPTRLEALPRERRGFFHSASISASGDSVVSAYDDITARLWRVDGRGDPVVVTVKGHDAWITTAVLSRDGARIATASFDKTARLTRVDGAGEPVVLRGHTEALRAVAFDPEGTRVATCSDDKTALVHRADGRGEPVKLAGHNDSVRAVGWSPDGKRVVTASLDGTARVYNADGSGEPLVLKGHTGGIYDVAFSPDGARILTTSLDATVKVWNAKSGEPGRSFGHGSYVFSAAWSPDGRRVATASRKDGLRLLDADGSNEPVVLEMPVPVIAMAFLDGGKRLLMVASDNTTRTLTIDIEALRQGMEGRNTDCLPPEMRVTYIGESPERAWPRYEACERRHGRTRRPVEDEKHGGASPAPADTSALVEKAAPPAASGDPAESSQRRASVVVLPGDATVEINGRRALRTNGVIELPGVAGASFRLRVFKGSKSTKEMVVTIQEAGASPPLIDLNEATAPSAAPAGGKAKPMRFEFGD